MTTSSRPNSSAPLPAPFSAASRPRPRPRPASFLPRGVRPRASASRSSGVPCAEAPSRVVNLAEDPPAIFARRVSDRASCRRVVMRRKGSVDPRPGERRELRAEALLSRRTSGASRFRRSRRGPLSTGRPFRLAIGGIGRRRRRFRRLVRLVVRLHVSGSPGSASCAVSHGTDDPPPTSRRFPSHFDEARRPVSTIHLPTCFP